MDSTTISNTKLLVVVLLVFVAEKVFLAWRRLRKDGYFLRGVLREYLGPKSRDNVVDQEFQERIAALRRASRKEKG